MNKNMELLFSSTNIGHKVKECSKQYDKTNLTIFQLPKKGSNSLNMVLLYLNSLLSFFLYSQIGMEWNTEIQLNPF